MIHIQVQHSKKSTYINWVSNSTNCVKNWSVECISETLGAGEIGSDGEEISEERVE